MVILKVICILILIALVLLSTFSIFNTSALADESADIVFEQWLEEHNKSIAGD